MGQELDPPGLKGNLVLTVYIIPDYLESAKKALSTALELIKELHQESSHWMGIQTKIDVLICHIDADTVLDKREYLDEIVRISDLLEFYCSPQQQLIDAHMHLKTASYFLYMSQNGGKTE